MSNCCFTLADTGEPWVRHAPPYRAQCIYRFRGTSSSESKVTREFVPEDDEWLFKGTSLPSTNTAPRCRSLCRGPEFTDLRGAEHLWTPARVTWKDPGRKNSKTGTLCDNAHAPWPGLAVNSDEKRTFYLFRMRALLTASARLGIILIALMRR